MRFTGKLRDWNDTRGFGFIVPTHGGADVFVHISALPNDGSRPTVGETLTYELVLGDKGRPQAANAHRLALGAARIPEGTVRRPPVVAKQSDSFVVRVAIFMLVVGLGAYAYRAYTERAMPALTPAQPSVMSQSQKMAAPISASVREATSPSAFTCDGRIHCSQMTSCTEAKLILANCPGTQLDGDNDGVPCEQQWCTGK